MKTVIQEIQKRLSGCEKLRYIAENWGQLELDNPPLLFPCVLVDISEVSYTQNLFRTQQGVATLTIDLANRTGQNVSHKTPQPLQESYYEFYDIMDAVSSLLHGYTPTGTSPLQRVSSQKQARKDGVKACRMTFTFSFTDEL